MAETFAVDFPRVIDFYYYMQQRWIANAEIASVFGANQRTNNAMENYNRRITQRLGGAHPNIWSFLGMQWHQCRASKS